MHLVSSRNFLRVLPAAMVVALALPASAAGASGTCKLAGSKTVVKNSAARVFQKKVLLRPASGGHATGYRVYGCLYAKDRRFLIGLQKPVDGEFEWISRTLVRLAGPFVGYAHGFDSGLDGGQFVEVRDLRTGEQVYRSENNNLVKVFDLELGAAGSVAWVSDEVESTPGRGVSAWGPSSGRTLLDSGPEISRRSLTLSGTTLSWTKAGVLRSAPLPG